MAYTKPKEKITDKGKIIAYAIEYLKEDSWLDMSGFVWEDMQYQDAPTSFIFDIAKRMERLGDYEMDIQETTNRYLIYALPKKLLRDRKPMLFQLLIICITVAVTTIAGLLAKTIEGQPQALINLQEGRRLDSLSFQLKGLQHDLNSLRNDPKKIDDSAQ